MNKKILLIEENHKNGNLLKEKLEVMGYDFLLAENGIKGIHIIHNENPDLIIIDCQLPNINGCEVCSLIKRDLRYKDIPIIMYSICKHHTIEDSALEKPDFIFHTPYKIDDFITKIEELIKKSEAKKEENRNKYIEQDMKWVKKNNVTGVRT